MQKRNVIALLTAILFIVCTVGYVFGQRWNREGGGGGGDRNIPPFMREMLEKEGISPEELQNNPELRQKMMEKFREMRNNPEFQGQMQQMQQTQQMRQGFGGEFRGSRGRAADLPEKYRVISENNLFRPLGYEEPKSDAGYRLVGIVSNSEPAETKALIVESNGNSYYVKAGQRIGNATVDKILNKQVVLIRDGNPIQLNMEEMQFMSSSAIAASSGGEGKGQAAPGGNMGGSQGVGGGSGGFEMLSQENMKKMSQEEQEKMRLQMRERGEGGGGGRGGPRGGSEGRLEFRGGGGDGGPRGNVIIRSN